MNKVWDGPERLPALREIYHPAEWVDRVGRQP